MLSVKERFSKYILVNGSRKHNDEPCWEWTGALDKDGYGKFRVGDRILRANKVAWLLVHGKVPKGLVVRHKCDNPKCVNAKHLELGTHQDNMDDMRSRGRAKNTTAKLTREQVEVIRDQVIRKNVPPERLARRYGVSTSAIHMAVNGGNWKLDLDQLEVSV